MKLNMIYLFCVVKKENEKFIAINHKNVEKIMFKEFVQNLRDVSKIEWKNDGHHIRIKASDEVLVYLDQQLKHLENEFHISETSILDAITELLRFFRNCTTDINIQQYIIEKTEILITVNSLLSKLVVDVNSNSVCLKVLLQFLVNLVSSSNRTASARVYSIFYCTIKNYLKSNINTYECSALIYYISLCKPLIDKELIIIILDKYYNNSENEFLLFFLERQVNSSYFWSMYREFEIENKLMILEILKSLLVQKSTRIPLVALRLLIDEFLKFAGNIFYMTEKDSELKASEISSLLEILSSISSDENYLANIQNKKDIIINAGILLINIHKLGKEHDNCFTPIPKLFEPGLKSKLNEHPAFGFKADLIRLIGNLCWKNIEIQNLTRTADLIPVILDCCNMDAKNPFIIQWSILAIRNICENNIENQNIIAGLHQEGAVTCEMLNEIGITLNPDGENKIKIFAMESIKRY